MGWSPNELNTSSSFSHGLTATRRTTPSGGARVEALDVGPRGVVIVVDDGFGPPGRGGVVVRRALELLEGRLPGRAVVQPRHLRLEVRIVGRERRRGRRRFGAGGRGGRATPAGARGVFSVFFVFFILLLLVVVVVSVFEPGVGAVHARVVEHVRHRHEALAAVRVQLEHARRRATPPRGTPGTPRGPPRTARVLLLLLQRLLLRLRRNTFGGSASRRHSAVREERSQALRVLADGDDPRDPRASSVVLAGGGTRRPAGFAQSVLVPRERSSPPLGGRRSTAPTARRRRGRARTSPSSTRRRRGRRGLGAGGRR